MGFISLRGKSKEKSKVRCIVHAFTFVSMNRVKDFIYTIIGWLASLGWRRSSRVKRILIIRVDEIGDYMLWRPFLKEIATQQAYRGQEIHFCGNKSWQTLFSTFDKGYVTKSFWMDKTRFKKKMSYRYHFLRALYQENYTTVINPTFSRDKRYDDSIVKALRAKERIGMVANRENVRPYEEGYDKGLYTHLFDHPLKPVFEFERNRLFTEFVTLAPCLVQNTRVDELLLPALQQSLPENYFVIFPGSRSAARIWPAAHFALAAHYLFDLYGWTAVIAGTKNDKPYIDAFCEAYTYPYLNLAGTTSLPQMLTLLKNAKCLISVDTGSVHLAAAVGCTVFGIFNGSQYKRFAPYPKEIAANFYTVYPDDVEKELEDESIVRSKYEFVVPVPYSSVKAEKVILSMDVHLGHGS